MSSACPVLSTCVHDTFFSALALCATQASRTPERAVCAFHVSVSLPFATTSEFLVTRQCDDELMTRDIISSSSSYNRCFIYYRSKVGKCRKAKRLYFAYKQKHNNNQKMFIFVKAPRTDTESRSNKLSQILVLKTPDQQTTRSPLDLPHTK